MTDSQITQCPKCHTTFRVTPAQLKVAKGAVRCGACLHVFKAAEHFQKSKATVATIQDDRTQDLFDAFASELSDDPTLEPRNTTKPSTAKSASPSSQPDPFDDDNLLISDDMDIDFGDDDDEDDGQIHDDMYAQPKEESADSRSLLDDDFLIDDSKGIDEDVLIYDDQEEDNSFANDLNEEFLSLDTNKDDAPLFHDAEPTMSDKKEDEDESWAEALLDDSEPAPDPSEEFVVKDDHYGIPPSPLGHSSAKKNKPIFDDEPASLEPVKASRPNVAYIQDNPIELHLPKKRRGAGIFWFLLVVILVGGLVGQLGYLNMAQWSRDPGLRPYYEMACNLADCSLPPMYDISKIRTTATPQVKTHPTYQNALSVDVLFMNGADYEQPFPLLELSFTNSQEKVIASRQFAPIEYLAGEGAGMKMMPVRVPVHISLEIRDPGEAAANYQVRFLPDKRGGF